MFDSPEFDDHESVTFVHDAATGLQAIIAIHSSALGHAMGGCRLWRYDTVADALDDALRLSRGMSLKNAMAGLRVGGGKAVILGPLPDARRDAALQAFGRAVEAMGGRYVTAEDVGVSVDDMISVARATRFVSGLVQTAGGAGGDPSPFTARGVLTAIEAAAQHVFGSADLAGRHVAVQGVGNVGGKLCELLAGRDVRLSIADIDPARAASVAGRTGAHVVPLDAVLDLEADILAPCALGGAIDAARAGSLRVRAVAGAANNQLVTPEAGRRLFDRGIVYVPDYVANAGGIIAVSAEYQGERGIDAVLAEVDAIGPRVAALLARSSAEGVPPHELADRMAREIINRARGRARD